MSLENVHSNIEEGSIIGESLPLPVEGQGVIAPIVLKGMTGESHSS